MALRKLTATLATLVLFGTGAAAAALADAPPTTTEPTTSASTTTTATTTSTTTSTAAATTTSTETTTTPAETTTTSAAPTSTTAASSPSRRAAPTHALPHGASVSDTPSGNVRPARPHRKLHRHRISKPLKVTPPLGQGELHISLSSVSRATSTATAPFGATSPAMAPRRRHLRPLGAPVVAVANGTINRVGWEKIGGWRLWVQDAAASSSTPTSPATPRASLTGGA